MPPPDAPALRCLEGSLGALSPAGGAARATARNGSRVPAFSATWPDSTQLLGAISAMGAAGEPTAAEAAERPVSPSTLRR